MAWPIGFPATFQFPWVIGFKDLSFFFTLVFLSFSAPSVCPFFFACFCHHPNPAPATLTLLQRRIPPATTVPFSKVRYFFDFSDFFFKVPL